jgi:hypothetical protein
VRKFLVFLSLWLGLEAGVFAAETFVLTDGASMSGEIVKFDDYEVMIHNTTADTYTNITWPRFSQDTLKQLTENPKYRLLAAPFVEPTAESQPAKPSLPYKYNQPLKLPEHPSILGGMFESSLGLFILLVIYGANLYAAYEVAVVRGKPVGAVMGLSAVLPIAGPIIFLAQPVTTATDEEPVEGMPPEGAGAPAGGPAAAMASSANAPASGPASGVAPAIPPHEEIQIVSASWQPSQEEKKPQPQVFARGKFTLNRRFIETKFASFVGEPKGEAKSFSMEIKTLKDTIAVESIKLVGPTELILETPTGQVTVPFSDIMEFKLIPRPPTA